MKDTFKLPFAECRGEEILVRLHIQPRASKNEVAGIYGGNALKIRLTSPPVEGAANAACREFIADLLNVRKKQVELISGQKSRIKLVRIKGLSPEEAEAVLLILRQIPSEA